MACYTTFHIRVYNFCNVLRDAMLFAVHGAAGQWHSFIGTHAPNLIICAIRSRNIYILLENELSVYTTVLCKPRNFLNANDLCFFEIFGQI